MPLSHTARVGDIVRIGNVTIEITIEIRQLSREKVRFVIAAPPEVKITFEKKSDETSQPALRNRRRPPRLTNTRLHNTFAWQ